MTAQMAKTMGQLLGLSWVSVTAEPVSDRVAFCYIKAIKVCFVTLLDEMDIGAVKSVAS